MAKFKVFTESTEIVTNIYEVEAENEDQAIEMVQDGLVEVYDSDIEVVDSDITVEEL